MFGPLKDDDVFEQQDFELLQNFENNRGGSKVSEIVSFYSAFTLTWIIVNDFQVEFFSINYRKQWKLSV